MALPYAKIILDRLAKELKPRGFRKHGQTFIRSINDCYQIVNLQASQWGHAGQQRYTINLAVYSTRLESLCKDASKLKASGGHWRARIGKFTEPRFDKWWQVHGDDEASTAGEEILALLPIALQGMDGISSYEALLNIPHGMGASSDDPPGHCRWDLIDVARKREGLSPSVELPYVDGQPDAWHRRHFPDYVPPEPKPNPLMDAIMRSRELGKSVPGVLLVTKDGVAPMANADE